MKSSSRSERAIKNIIISVAYQVVNVLCGLVVPHALLSTFGSEIYGATSSITHFLAYISLLEGGVGGVARAALYSPLAENDIQKTSNILYEIKKFFRIIGLLFTVYVFVIAVFFDKISGIQALDWISTFFLVVVISLSTFAQYFIGISNNTLLYAAQRAYVTNGINIFTIILNAGLVVGLCKLGCNVIIVKLVSSCVFILRPVGSWIYVKRNFDLLPPTDKHTKALKQKWTGLGQHLAYFLHTNTDVVVLTIFGDLTMVAVYSVYHMVVSSIENFASSCMSGMESLCGEMIAKKENEKLNLTFSYYQTFMSIIITTMFTCTITLIIPFVELYTKNVNDANYYAPVFAIVLILASVVFCIRVPYHAVVVAAGHFKQTRFAAYGEAFINIVLSIVLVSTMGLIGVAIGTVAATLFRLIYYVIYVSRHIMYRNISLFVKREVINFIIICVSSLVGFFIVGCFDIADYFIWAITGVLVFIETAIITYVCNRMFYKKECLDVVKRIRKKIHI